MKTNSKKIQRSWRTMLIAVVVALFFGDHLAAEKSSGARSNRSEKRGATNLQVIRPKLKEMPRPAVDTEEIVASESKPALASNEKTSTKQPEPTSAPILAVEPKTPIEPSGTIQIIETKTDVKSDAVASQPAGPRGPILKSEFGDIEIFPGDNPWNQEVSKLRVHAQSKQWIDSIGADRPLFPCFGADYNGAPNGIPYVVVDGKQMKKFVEFEYPDESDPGPYPIPSDPPIEGGPRAPKDSDRHVIMIDAQNKKLYELFHVLPGSNGSWQAGSGAIFDLNSNKLRPWGWTSADAAGLPIFPGLVRYDETVEQGEIKHALRFTVRRTQRAFIAPATHFASRSNDPGLPPMGLRVRLRADYDVSKFPKSAQVILTCLKKYGMLLADNGSDWFITGCPDNRWVDEELHTLKRVKGRDLECVETGELRTDSR